MPLAVREAALIADLDCRPTLAELDSMPQELVNNILLYKNIEAAIKYGVEVDL